MKLLTTKLHGLIDYALGISMIISMCLFSLNWNESLALLVSGIITLLYSAATNYEVGFTAQLSVRQHLRMDVISGTILCLLPLAGFVDYFSFVELFGLMKIIIGVITSPSMHKEHGPFPYKRYEMPLYGKFEKFPSMKWE